MQHKHSVRRKTATTQSQMLNGSWYNLIAYDIYVPVGVQLMLHLYQNLMKSYIQIPLILLYIKRFSLKPKFQG